MVRPDADLTLEALAERVEALERPVGRAPRRAAAARPFGACGSGRSQGGDLRSAPRLPLACSAVRRPSGLARRGRRRRGSAPAEERCSRRQPLPRRASRCRGPLRRLRLRRPLSRTRPLRARCGRLHRRQAHRRHSAKTRPRFSALAGGARHAEEDQGGLRRAVPEHQGGLRRGGGRASSSSSPPRTTSPSRPCRSPTCRPRSPRPCAVQASGDIPFERRARRGGLGSARPRARRRLRRI